ncbi:MAG: hypothetical protein Q8O67_24190 [Deltaproteobacteria bacterium]|nr:hypothetical protein [Deltaproteobacteria bacterium]
MVAPSSGAERVLWRLSVYENISRACAQTGIAPLRFLTFRPDRVRLRIGESLARSQVPVVFAADLADRLAALLPPATPVPAGSSLGLDRDSLRRAIALAQLDADIDPIDVATWAGAEAFLDALTSLYQRFFDEARAAGSGEETAALFQLLLFSSLRNVLVHHVGASERFLGMGAFLAHLADRALAATVEQKGEGLSARLGLLLAASCSPIALMGQAAAVVARPGNIYRTTPAAYERARDLVRAQADKPGGFDVAALRALIAAELLSSPVHRRDLVRSLIADGARDLALLSTLTQGSELRDVASRSAVLTQVLFEQPERLLARLSRHPRAADEPLPRLAVLVDSVSAMLAGDTAALAALFGGAGSIDSRADLVAAGALLLALDELTLDQASRALAMVRPVPEAEADKAREDGRAYYFSLDDEPLFRLPRARDEAFLFADMKDFTKRTAAIREDAMADFLKERFYDPILNRCAQIARDPQARLAVVNLLGDAVAVRGDIESMLALAIFIRRLLADAAVEMNEAARALRPEDDAIVKEIDGELLRLGRALAALPPADPSRLALMQEERDLREGKEQRLTKAIGMGLEAGVFVTWGREASVISCGGPEIGEWKVTIAEQLNAAARGTNRSADLVAVRQSQRTWAEQQLGRPLIEAFHVHTAADPRDVAAGRVFHNAGAALTAEALQAYQAATRDRLVFRPLNVARASLPPSLAHYWAPRDVEELILCLDREGVPGLIFRRAGGTVFRGLEAVGSVDVWELLLVDRGFGRDFVAAIALAGRASLESRRDPSRAR